MSAEQPSPTPPGEQPGSTLQETAESLHMSPEFAARPGQREYLGLLTHATHIHDDLQHFNRREPWYTEEEERQRVAEHGSAGLTIHNVPETVDHTLNAAEQTATLLMEILRSSAQEQQIPAERVIQLTSRILSGLGVQAEVKTDEPDTLVW